MMLRGKNLINYYLYLVHMIDTPSTEAKCFICFKRATQKQITNREQQVPENRELRSRSSQARIRWAQSKGEHKHSP